MALLHFDGFDASATISTLVTRYNSGTEAKTIIVGRTNNGLRIDGNTSTSPLVTYALGTANGTAIVGFAFRTNEFAAADFLQILEGSTVHVALALDVTGHIIVKRGSTTLATSSSTIAVDTWMYIELKTAIHDSAGTYLVRVDEATFGGLSATGQDTRNGGTGQWDAVSLRSASGSVDNDFDDYYVCDAAGANNNDFLGDSKVQTLLPQTDAVAAGTNASFTPSTGSDHGALVDEASPNGDTDYNSSSTVGHIDTYNYPSLSLTGTIRGVQVMPYIEKTDAGARTVSAVTRVGGSNFVCGATAISPSTGYRYWGQQIFELNPNSSSAWLAADVNGAEFGLKIIT
jgi:hypothetical protein